jgi:peptide deformylase
MAVLEILTAPHPVLEMRARHVADDEFGDALAAHVRDMAETMYAAPGVGLAAPQVGDGRRILVIDSSEKSERGKRFFALINPVIVARSAETIDWNETCLSVPDFECETRRARQITLSWRSPTGEACSGTFEDYEAVIVQHEMDHLDGTVILDKSSLFKRSRYLKKVRAVRQRALAQ